MTSGTQSKSLTLLLGFIPFFMTVGIFIAVSILLLAGVSIFLGMLL